MKFPNQKNRQGYQDLLDKQAKLKTQLRELQNQIEEFETAYFQKYWNEGNVVLGWSKMVSSPPPNNAPKIKLVAKDKPFSFSSATSKVNFQLEDIMDKNLLPFPENKFQAKYFFFNTAKKGKIRKTRRHIKAAKKESYVEEDLDFLYFQSTHPMTNFPTCLLKTKNGRKNMRNFKLLARYLFWMMKKVCPVWPQFQYNLPLDF